VASAPYPRHNAKGCERNRARVCIVAFADGGFGEPEEGEDDFADVSTICAFCLMTSAGVRMAHETSSATADAAELMSGAGRWNSDAVDGLALWRRDFVPS